MNGRRRRKDVEEREIETGEMELGRKRRRKDVTEGVSERGGRTM